MPGKSIVRSQISLVLPLLLNPITLATETKTLRLDLAKAAILVIDMQNDFCHPKGWLAHIGVDVTSARNAIEPLQTLLPALRAANVPVIWVNWGNRPDLLNISAGLRHVYNPTGQGIGLGDPLPHKGAPVLTVGSWAAAVVDELEQKPEDIRVDKYRMSGFWDTPLDSILRNLGKTTLFFAGVNIDQCVMTTLQDANFLGYDCILVKGCATTTSPEYCYQATILQRQPMLWIQHRLPGNYRSNQKISWVKANFH